MATVVGHRQVEIGVRRIAHVRRNGNGRRNAEQVQRCWFLDLLHKSGEKTILKKSQFCIGQRLRCPTSAVAVGWPCRNSFRPRSGVAVAEIPGR